MIRALKNFNYKIDFVESDLVNNKEKFAFSAYTNKFHDVTYLKHSERCAVEIVEYKKIEKLKSNILFSFESKLDNKDVMVDKIKKHLIYYNDLLNIEYFVSNQNEFIFKVNDVKKEIDFWGMLGFKGEGCKVEIKSPISQWNGIINFESCNCKYNYMDNLGFNTLCLLTNNIEKYRVDAKKSEIFNITINQKEVRILLTKRDNYNIELLEMR